MEVHLTISPRQDNELYEWVRDRNSEFVGIVSMKCHPDVMWRGPLELLVLSECPRPLPNTNSMVWPKSENLEPKTKSDSQNVTLFCRLLVCIYYLELNSNWHV